MALEASFEQLCAKANVSEAAMAFMRTQGVLIILDFGLVGGSDESKLDTTLIEVFKGGDVPVVSLQS